MNCAVVSSWNPVRILGRCALAVLALAIVTATSRAAVSASQVPLFHVKCRITSAGGAPSAGKVFTVRLAGGAPSTVTGDVWTASLALDRTLAEAAVKAYPNAYAGGWPVAVSLQIGGVIDPTIVDGELTLEETGQVVPIHGELTGPNLGLLVWREEDKTPAAATMTAYNRRFWKHLAAVNLPADRRPKKFPIVDRYIGGDDDRVGWNEGLSELNKAGFSALMIPPSAQLRRYALTAGVARTAWAIYNPPGYAFDYGTNLTQEAIESWAQALADEYTKAGFKTTDLAVYTISDEPGWYYPSMFAELQKSEHGMARFREYLKAQKLKPQELGLAKWEDAKPLGRAQAKDLPTRRRFYWSMRFFAWDSARHFAVSARAMEKAFYPGLPLIVNWNNFAGRSYVPGPVANNAAKTDPNAAMGGHDWLEFGELRGATAPCTEDWFGDEQAWQWSFYASKLRCAAARGAVEFGGLIIPRTAGSRPDGIIQKLLTLVGSGGKVVQYFVFGPEYVFPGNCYSFKSELLPKMAEAHGMIGAAEDVLWPGRRPAGEVAIVMPRSSQLWDAKDVAIPTMIQDMTITAPWRHTVDYMAETFCLYTALQHANLTVDWLDEDDLAKREQTAKYKVIYLTGPNLPSSTYQPLKDWVAKGGTLATVQNAASRDRYNDPADLLALSFKVKRQPTERLLVANVSQLKPAATATWGGESFGVVGPSGDLVGWGQAAAGAAAAGPLVQPVGHGRLVHYPFFPGMSYFQSAKFATGRLPEGFSAPLRACIVEPARLAGVMRAVEVDRPFVETPLLVSAAGAAVTILNWSNDPQTDVKLSVRVPFAVKSVTSVRRGPVPFGKTATGFTCTVAVDAADILVVKP